MEPIIVSVAEVLKAATSQDCQIIQSAEAKLKEWEVQSGFFTVLLRIISTYSIDVNVRYMAVFYMKNKIKMYWNTNVPNAISEEEKKSIRETLLTRFDEPADEIASQKAFLIKEIFKLDCGKEWPDVISVLKTATHNPDEIVQYQSLLIFNHVVDVICSKKIRNDGDLFYHFSVDVYDYVTNMWVDYTNMFMNDILKNTPSTRMTRTFKKAMLSLKISRHISLFGLRRRGYTEEEFEHVTDFLKLIFLKLEVVLIFRTQYRSQGQLVIDLCENYILLSITMITDFIIHRPIFFIDFIQPTLKLTYHYLFTEEGMAVMYEGFAIHCFKLIKTILSGYKPVSMGQLPNNPDTFRAHEIKQLFFRGSTIMNIFKKSVSHYFIMTEVDLKTWEEDSESFFINENINDWQYSVREGLQELIVDLFHEYKIFLIPVLSELISETNESADPENIQAVLKKEVVYNVVSLCSKDLRDQIDFNHWFRTTLQQELQNKHKNYRIVRKRVLSMIGVWMGVEPSSEMKSMFHMSINELLSFDEDIGVRLSAANTLGCAMNDVKLNHEQFTHLILDSFNLIFALLKEVRECDTKMYVLKVMISVIERIEIDGGFQLDAVLHYLPCLWQASVNHNMLKCTIVNMLTELVKVLGRMEPEWSLVVFPIVQYGTDTTQDAILYLMDDSLDLWLTVLDHSPKMTMELMTLFHNMPSLLQYCKERPLKCLLICLVHSMLDPERVMQTNGVQILKVCVESICSFDDEERTLLIRLVEYSIRSSPQLGLETTHPILAIIFEAIFLQQYPSLMPRFLSILARVLLASPSVFTDLVMGVARVHDMSDEDAFKTILDVWLNEMKIIVGLDERKLLGLALVNILSIPSGEVLYRFSDIMSNILICMRDITTPTQTGILIDSLIFKVENSRTYEGTDEFHESSIRYLLADPVHTISLKDHLQSNLFSFKNVLSLQRYQLLLQTIPGDIISQLKCFVNLYIL